jgi:hypothetical protein
MSPVKRPSSVTSLRRGLATAAAAAPEIRQSLTDLAPRPRPEKPVRVTLNFPPELFRQLDRWTRDAAETVGEPRAGVQDAVRAMVHVIASGEAANAESRVLAQLRSELEQQRRRRKELRSQRA